MTTADPSTGARPSIREREANLPGLLPEIEPSAARKFVIYPHGMVPGRAAA